MKKKVRICIGITLFILCAAYLHKENTALQVSVYLIEDSRIPKDFNGFKIIQISDFHNTGSESLRNDLIEEIQNQNPDILVLTGDLIDANRTDLKSGIEFISRMTEIAPVYFVSGNHEASIQDYPVLEEQLKQKGGIVLSNDAVNLKKNEDEIILVGIADPQMAHESFVSDLEIVKTELSRIRYDFENYCILLAHRPELIDAYAEVKLDLVLAGHAHGGQIRLPFIGGLFAPNQGFFPDYTSGLIEKDGTKMIVSRGIGNSVFPFRINNRPELAVIILRSQ